MPIPIKPFWPTLAQNMHTMCKFIQVHQSTLTSVVASVDPLDAVAVAAAFTALNGFCTLFIAVMSHVDPNWKPE